MNVPVLQAFDRGFQSVCGGSALQLFLPSEIELLVCGSPELDFRALEASTTYEDGFTRWEPWCISHAN